MRNEAHRFGITHYRSRHRASLKKSQLEEIPGIGKKRAADLLSRFKSVRRMQTATQEELQAVVGLEAAHRILEFFSANSAEKPIENRPETEQL